MAEDAFPNLAGPTGLLTGQIHGESRPAGNHAHEALSPRLWFVSEDVIDVERFAGTAKGFAALPAVGLC